MTEEKASVLCNFCSSSSRYGCSSEQSLGEQDNEAVREVQRLQLLIKRMNGKDDSVSFSELLSLQSHLKEVWLIVIDQKVMRMNGRELQGMTSFDLLRLDTKIQHAFAGLRNQQMGPRREQIARQQKETTKEQYGRCSLDIVNDESHRGDITSRKRSTPVLVTVSRKLRRFQNRHRRSMP